MLSKILAAALLLPLAAFAQTTSDEYPCYPLEYLYARGTTEPLPLGYYLGPGLKQELDGLLGDQYILVGVDYPASGALNSASTGITNLVAAVRERAAACPDTKFAISGYSQGAAVMHQALNQIAQYQDRISSMVNFGDPYATVGFPTVYEGRVMQCCTPADSLCGGRPGAGVGHTAYGQTNLTRLHIKAAAFVAETFQNPPPIPEGASATLVLPGFGQPGTGQGYVPPTTWE